MIKRLVILAFVVTVVGNALTGVTPHLDGEGGCSMSCCEDARQNGKTSAFSRLCCITDCGQPAGGTSSITAASVMGPKQKPGPVIFLVTEPETDTYVRQVRFPTSPTRNLAGSSDRFLESGALLI